MMIWVNGVQGINRGDGTWIATNVPIRAGSTASFHVSAYPATSSGSTKSNTSPAGSWNR